MIDLAKKLKSQECPYHITMIGEGHLKQPLESEAENNNLEIEFLGNITNDEVQAIMQQSQIFCFTSDRQEGWGAVLNEAMGNGCCPVACIEAGATPFLINDGKNGYTYNHRDYSGFQKKIISLINDPQQLASFQKNAFETIHETWNADKAARNLYHLSESLLRGGISCIEYGPCSKS